MMKKTLPKKLSVLLILLSVLLIGCAGCSDLQNNVTKGLEFTLNDDGKSYAVTGIGTATDRNVRIPSVYKGKPVTAIGDEAFSGCDISYISIPESVTSIGQSAFSECSDLSRVLSWGGVTNIGILAFYKCESLDLGVIPCSVTSIGNGAFMLCTDLTDLWIREGVTSIGDNAFAFCHRLSEITIPESVTNIGSGAFGYCEKLTSIFFVGSSIDAWNNIKIGSENTSLTSATIYFYSESEPTVPGNFWYWSNGSSGVPRIYENKEMPDDDFGSCGPDMPDDDFGFCGPDMPDDDPFYPETPTPGLEFTLNNDGKSYSVTGIGTATDQRIVIPAEYQGKPVTGIGKKAFYECSNLTDIVIPDSVTKIGKDAFKYCYGLTSMTIPFVGQNKDGTGKTHFGYIFGAEYSADQPNYIPNSLRSVVITGGTSIGNEAFVDCYYLTNIIIPDSVTSIGDQAFSYCGRLTRLVLPEGVTSIGKFAFYSCHNLTSVYYGGSSADDWNNIKIGNDNSDLTSAMRYYYSASNPTVPGNFWHWSNGTPSIW